MLQIDLNTMALFIGILATIIGGALWVMGLVNKISVRATNIERDAEDLEKRLTKVEGKTDYKYQEGLVTEIIVKVLNSKEVRDTLKSQMKEVILHIDKNLSAERASAFDLLLEEIRELKNSIDNKQ